LKIILIPLALVLTSLCHAQSTCFTDPYGTTICSSPGKVIQGSTNSIGHSLYRDDRGNQLDFQTDQSGKASVKLPSGESINWSQGVLGEKKYPFNQGIRQGSTMTPGEPLDATIPPPAISPPTMSPARP
jgi:hypothetical protein